jgi:hypothetical protein
MIVAHGRSPHGHIHRFILAYNIRQKISSRILELVSLWIHPIFFAFGWLSSLRTNIVTSFVLLMGLVDCRSIWVQQLHKAEQYTLLLYTVSSTLYSAELLSTHWPRLARHTTEIMFPTFPQDFFSELLPKAKTPSIDWQTRLSNFERNLGYVDI